MLTLAVARALAAWRGEVEACLCVSCHVVTAALAEIIHAAPAARAVAVFLQRGGDGQHELGEKDRDIESLCALLGPRGYGSD